MKNTKWLVSKYDDIDNEEEKENSNIFGFSHDDMWFFCLFTIYNMWTWKSKGESTFNLFPHYSTKNIVYDFMWPNRLKL